MPDLPDHTGSLDTGKRMGLTAAPAEGTAGALLALIEGRIQVMQGLRVMIDADLAALYGVPTKVSNQAVKRNAGRFPPDFMFRQKSTTKRLRLDARPDTAP